MTVVAIIQARMGSTRLPQKTLMDISGKPLLWHIVDRLKRAKKIAKIVVATSDLESNNVIEEFCKENGFNCFRGSEEDVLSRFYFCAKEHNATHIVRITADNPLIDSKNIDIMIDFHIKNNSDLTYTVNMPIGCGPGNELISFKSLKKSHLEAKEPEFREHADEYIIHNMNLFKIMSIDCTLKKEHPEYRLTVDTKADFDLITEIYKRLYKDGEIVDLNAVLDFLEENQDLASINAEIEQHKVLVK